MSLHMDEKYYENPTKFDPDRFNEQNMAGNRPYLPYLPFGDGPRNCIGLRLGKLQTKVGLIMMLEKFKFGFDDTNYQLKYDPSIFLLSPKQKIRLSVSKR